MTPLLNLYDFEFPTLMGSTPMWVLRGGGGGCWSKNYFAHFSTQPFHCTFIMISMKNMEKKIQFFFPRLVSMEMAVIFDFRALAKVHLTSKPLLQMQ